MRNLLKLKGLAAFREHLRRLWSRLMERIKKQPIGDDSRTCGPGGAAASVNVRHPRARQECSKPRIALGQRERGLDATVLAMSGNGHGDAGPCWGWARGEPTPFHGLDNDRHIDVLVFD